MVGMLIRRRPLRGDSGAGLSRNERSGEDGKPELLDVLDPALVNWPARNAGHTISIVAQEAAFKTDSATPLRFCASVPAITQELAKRLDERGSRPGAPPCANNP